MAICEGDDYWIDENKLQKQVDYLEEHEDCTLCATDALIKCRNGIIHWTRYDESLVVPFEDLIIHGGLWLQTVTYVFRIETYSTMIECGKNCHVGDYPLILWCAMNGSIFYINEKTSVYRYGYGWTANNSKSPLQKQINGWRSEVDMLLGFDEYSGRKYTHIFRQRIVDYILGRCKANTRFVDTILQNFEDCRQFFSLRDKFKLLLIRTHLSCILLFASWVMNNFSFHR